jgi:hypothetical protein
VIVDQDDRIIAAFVAPPNDPDWPEVVQDAVQCLYAGHRSSYFTETRMSHRRGDYAAVAAGVTAGNGQSVSQ